MLGEHMMKKSKWFQKTDGVLVTEAIVIGVILIPIMIISFYAIPAADDFYNTMNIKTRLSQHHFYVTAAISEVIYYYKNISGYYFSAFLNFFVSPLLRGGTGALRWTVFLINLFFYGSLYFLVNESMTFFYEVKDKRVTFLVYIVILFAFTNNQYHLEMTTWYCSMIGYVLIVACMFGGVIFFIKAIRENKVKYVIAASVLGFLVSGSSLNVTALHCGVYLLIAFICFKVYKKRKNAIIIFGSALAGGIINAVAPGNFIRHGTDSYPIFHALGTASYYGKKQIQELLFYSPFILSLCILFIITLAIIKKPRPIKGWHLLMYAGIIMLGIIMVNFPVCLGYTVDYFPDRCVWIENCVIYFGSFSWIMCLAEWFRNKFGDFKIQKDTFVCIGISFILYGCCLCTVRDLSDYPTIDMIKQLASGEIADYVGFWEEVFDEIEHAEGDGVIIYREEIRTNKFIPWPQIIEDKNNDINKSAAEYYGKSWVIMTTESEEGA